MRRLLLLLGLCAATARAAGPAPKAGDDPWLSRLVGHWVLEGRIAGKDTAHDVDAEWVLNHLYVRLHEVSREMDSRGRPAYEAIVYVTWYPAAAEYAVMWLDSTGSGGFAAEGTGHAKPSGESLPFVFKDAHGVVTFRNTFAYEAASDTWTWLMDNVDKDVSKPFGRVKLSRRDRPALPSSRRPDMHRRRDPANRGEPVSGPLGMRAAAEGIERTVPGGRPRSLGQGVTPHVLTPGPADGGPVRFRVRRSVCASARGAPRACRRRRNPLGPARPS